MRSAVEEKTAQGQRESWQSEWLGITRGGLHLPSTSVETAGSVSVCKMRAFEEETGQPYDGNLFLNNSRVHLSEDGEIHSLA